MNTRIAIVTGASRAQGIGFEVCRQLGRLGFEVVLTARSVRDAQERAQELLNEGLQVRALPLDVSQEASVTALRETVESDIGRLDVLINNAAGMSPYGEAAATADLATAHAVFETTLFGSWRMIQAFLPLLRTSEHARIVNVSSGAGSHGDQMFGLTTDSQMGTSYAVSKAALNALTVKVAKDTALDNILVNAVCPGFTATFEGGDSMGARPVSEGAAGVVWAATLPDGGPTGQFFRDGKPMPW